MNKRSFLKYLGISIISSLLLPGIILDNNLQTELPDFINNNL